MSAAEFPIDPGNAEQAHDWDGADGEYWATYHREYERLLGVFDTTLVRAADVRSDDRCLDVGCGTGATTRALAVRAENGSVLGLDLSGPMLRLAREGAERANLHHVELVQADAQVHPFDPESFDVVVSRMGCMFFADPATAFGNIGRALRPGGRLAMTVWQEVAANAWITAIDAAFEEPEAEAESEPTGYVPGPFSLADPELCRSLLVQAGFVDIGVEALDIPLAFGTVEEAETFLHSWMDDEPDEAVRARKTSSLHRLLLDHATADGVRLPSATWLLTARRPELRGHEGLDEPHSAASSRTRACTAASPAPKLGSSSDVTG